MQLFNFENVSTGDSFALSAQEQDGQVWFVAADVCKSLGLRNSRQSLATLDDDDKDVRSTDTLGGVQQVATVNESGLYTLIFRSRKESARRFKKWVTSVVLPAIRTQGGYINGQEALSAAQQAKTLQAVQDEALRVRAVHVEERDARSSALKIISRSRSYGPGGRKGGRSNGR
jgi:prophage antirepressor-like protein